MVMQMKMMYRGLCKLFDSCPSVPYTPTVYFILLQKFDKNSYLMHKSRLLPNGARRFGTPLLFGRLNN